MSEKDGVNEVVKTNMTQFMEGMKKYFVVYVCDTVGGVRGM